MKLPDPMRDLLWTVAQHKYGWAHVSRQRGQLQVADGLLRRGLITYVRAHGRDYHDPHILATEDGLVEIGRRWPVSPYVLGTYEHQPGGWTPREGVVA